jgi:hypothetical protein
VSEWSDMSKLGLLFQWASTVKIQLACSFYWNVTCSFATQYLQIRHTILQCLKEALARHQGMKDDYHIPAFAMYEMASIYMKMPEV